MTGIERTPGPCGGDACIAGTRYPTLHSSDLAAAWVFADAHRPEIDEAIRINETA
jgi:uncharacterized protein (DUF433 family)